MCSRKGLLFLFWCVLEVAGEEDKGQVAMNWNRKKKRTSWVWFAHAPNVQSASKPLGDKSVYIFICLRLHPGDRRTGWPSDGENQASSITRASQSIEDKPKTRSKVNLQKHKEISYVFIYGFIISCKSLALEENWSEPRFWNLISLLYSMCRYFDNQCVGRCSQPENLFVF